MATRMENCLAVTDKAAEVHWDHIHFCFWSVNKIPLQMKTQFQSADGLAHEEDLKI